jgi:hypothetical protein
MRDEPTVQPRLYGLEQRELTEEELDRICDLIELLDEINRGAGCVAPKAPVQDQPSRRSKAPKKPRKGR